MSIEANNQKIEEVSSDIEQLIATTEDLYGAIFDQLPSLESEIDLTAREVEILLDFFIHHNERESSGESVQQLSRILKQVEAEVRQTTANMVDEQQIRKIIESFLRKGDSEDEISVEDVMEVIYKVKERITDIELISMNAIIFSGKLGEEGKAFGVISDNIMSFSNKVDSQYRSMEEHALGLGSWNQKFTDSLDVILKYHNRLTTEQIHEFVGIFDSVFSSLETVRKVLGELNSTVYLAVEPVQELMVKIQVQDILRQGLENVQKCLLTVVDNNQKFCLEDKCTPEQRMDILSFNRALIQLVIDLLMSIKERLLESLEEIEQPINLMKHQLSGLVEDESALAEYFGGKEFDTNAIKEIFQKVNSFLDTFDTELTELEQQMTEFTSINDSFYGQINEIEKRIRKIKSSVGHLQKLNILSRIELSRINLQGTAFVSQIQSISDQVIKEVDKNEQYVTQLKGRLQNDLRQFQLVLGNNIARIVEMKQVVISAKDKLSMIEGLIIDAIRPIGATSIQLYKEIVSIGDKLTVKSDIYQMVESIEARLFDIYGLIEDEYRQGLDDLGLETWENKSHDLEEILQHFTTHSERVVAQLHMNDKQVDIGSEDGELTLF
ncbi:hypothetical protein [Desulfuribacillus alkaliarsenatis]|uniref:Methyl-accepting transducer domain-containing protein n=1 Tax=Desulfuribacillus alkaliarsenatis TaxID=766136 RepID=A0A1E5FZE3_9FIRM|nr:hypothetical protein [Desulfuribacillus alkaliarsenatis]OEF95818.1 hypothetical protein BHF68_10485 [Desulfuribacillus alkaliarsenatis]